MDWLDLCLKFSGEIIAIIVTLAVVATNLTYFHLQHFSDNSHAAWFLNLHPHLNPQLAAKNSTIQITVASASFFPQARADDFSGLDAETLPTAETDSTDYVNSNGTMVKPNPDSVQGLIDKQIKIHETQSGESLNSIAQEYGISAQTIKWANKLPSDSIKPGWMLLILPTDGVLYKATINDTLPDVAKKFKGDLSRIIAYNGKENAEDIDGGDLIIIPGGQMPEPPKPAPSKNSRDGKVKPGGVSKPNYVDNGTGHLFPWGYCTWYVATRLHIPWGGNAKNWLANARASGMKVDKTPTPGSVVVTNDSRWGHVAYVEVVEEDGIVVSEMNYERFGRVNQRKIPLSSKTIRGYIHP